MGLEPSRTRRGLPGTMPHALTHPPPHVLCLPRVCRRTLIKVLNTFNQRRKNQCRKKAIKQDKVTNSLAIKQSPGASAPPQGDREQHSALCPLSCLGDNETPARWEKLTGRCPQHGDHRPVAARRLRMLSPDYLITSQSEDCPRADHTPHPASPTLVLKACPRRPSVNLGLLSTSCPDSLLSSRRKPHFPSPRPWVPRLASLRKSGPKAGSAAVLGDRSPEAPVQCWADRL